MCSKHESRAIWRPSSFTHAINGRTASREGPDPYGRYDNSPKSGKMPSFSEARPHQARRPIIDEQGGGIATKPENRSQMYCERTLMPFW